MAMQCLLTLLDSPINKAGKLQIYIHTSKNVLIRVSPTVRIPRTFKRFAGLMVQLLHRHQIRSTSSQEKLIEVIKYVELRKVERGVVIASVRVLEDNEIEPSAAALTACCDTDFVAHRLKLLAKLVQLFGRKGS